LYIQKKILSTLINKQMESASAVSSRAERAHTKFPRWIYHSSNAYSGETRTCVADGYRTRPPVIINAYFIKGGLANTKQTNQYALIKSCFYFCSISSSYQGFCGFGMATGAKSIFQAFFGFVNASVVVRRIVSCLKAIRNLRHWERQTPHFIVFSESTT